MGFGQVWAYQPSTETLTLVVESPNHDVFDGTDTPGTLGIGVADPLVGDGHPARVGHATVHHDRSAVIALVEPGQLAEACRTESLDLAARGPERVHVLVGRLHPAAGRGAD